MGIVVQITEQDKKARPSKLKDYLQLTKAKLSIMVVYSSIIGYLLAPHAGFTWHTAVLMAIGSSLITISANIINQILERESDKFMHRTQNRPLPDGRMKAPEAWVLVIIFGVLGVAIICYFFNFLAGMLGLLSLLLYGFAYTPMKKIHPISTFIGAIPGAFPPLIGWVAATGSLSGIENFGGWSLFLIQFFWQFPHFWAIAWVGYDDYLRAGIRMLPSHAGKTKYTGLQCMYYSLTMIPLGMIPYAIHLSGTLSMWVAIIFGIIYFAASYMFYRRSDNSSAKGLMYTSFLYIPVVFLAFLYDKL
ncbi:heme o synthase [Taibaiella sp. KBW10]|uniref:heme o synthase n=1 Tax=Taibaiella sp. KBW10 TaxID=2153357 RepID=UPI0018F54025|nr:heme o synthase [Taibaiella sp. KBW10]